MKNEHDHYDEYCFIRSIRGMKTLAIKDTLLFLNNLEEKDIGDLVTINQLKEELKARISTNEYIEFNNQLKQHCTQEMMPELTIGGNL